MIDPAKITTVAYDHHSADFVRDHQQVHHDLRELDTVVRSSSYGGFLVLTRYRDVFAAAHDHATFSSVGGGLIPTTDVGRLLPIMVDPPLTEQYRAVISPYLTPRALHAAAPPIQADIDAAIAVIVESGRAELVGALCNPIPARATMRLLGLQPDDWEIFAVPLHDASLSLPGSPKNLEAIARIQAFSEIIEAEVDARYRHRRDDLISALIGSQVDGGPLSRQDVIDIVRMLIFGGMDTVTAALGNIFATLALRSDLRHRMAADPAGLGKAIEEFLRYEAPIQGFARHVTTDTELAGCPIQAGDRVWLGWGSANHDETIFECPEQLQLERTPNRHMSFGVGAHRCMGSTLARIEMRLVLESFLAAIPDFALAEPGVVEPETIGQILGKRAVHIKVTRAAGQTGVSCRSESVMTIDTSETTNA